MKLEITLDIDPNAEDAPTQKEMREYLLQYLNYQNPYDARRFIVSAKVTAKRERAK